MLCWLIGALCMLSVTPGWAFNDTVSLIELDRRLTELVLHPRPGQGGVLLSDGYFLYNNLDDVSDMIEAKNPKGTKIYEDIESAGGLKFYKAAYDPDTVRDVFKYNADDYELLIATMGGIENTWKSIQLMLNVTAPEVKHAVNPQTQW